MNRLEEIRNHIDQYDKQLVELFEKRMEMAIEALEYKQKRGLPILHPNREKAVIDKVKANLKNAEFESELEQLYKTMMTVSRKVQAKRWNLTDLLLIGDSIVLPLGERLNQKKIVFQGEPGAFGHQALMNHFGSDDPMIHVEKFEDVFIALQKGEADYGVLPIENSSTGAIHDVYDLLLEYELYIVGEEYLPVEHHLLGLKGSKVEGIKEVYSHIQGFRQCQTYLKDQSWEQRVMENTAASAKYVQECQDQTKAAIASKQAAKIYDLKILKENIHSNKENWTRFIVIGRKVEVKQENRKVSLLYSLRHNVGSLYDSLGLFREYGINLVKLESRPIANKPWEYHFYVDIEGNLLDEKVQKVIGVLQENSPYLKVLGNY